MEPIEQGATNLYLIRHGESRPQAERIVGGMRGDGGLTPLGVAQAERLRDRLAATGEIAADVLVASTMPRARRTAEILASAFGQPITWDDEVQELRPGEADGMPDAEAEARYRLSATESDPFRPLSPGGESWAQFTVRAASALQRLARAHADRTIVVVCHGGIVVCSFLTFFQMPTLAPSSARLSPRNTSITHWQRETGEASDGRWRLMCYNDAMHLFEAGGHRVDWTALAGPPQAGTSRPAVPLPSDEQAAPAT